MHIITVVRHYLQMSQVKLSRSAGITQADLSEIENLKPYGQMDKYCRLSAFLGISVEAIVKNDFTKLTENFFARFPEPQYSPEPKSATLLMGRRGEEYILARERARLQKKHPALAKLVLPYFKLKMGFPGYDILSFDDEGKAVCIEVKTSTLDLASFRITENEISSAEKLTQRGETYIFTKISNWGTEDMHVEDLPFAALQQDYDIIPGTCVCIPKPKKKDKINGLAYYRKLRGLRQKDIEEVLGISACDWSLYENGGRKMSVNTYLRVSELLEATLDELLAEYDFVEKQTSS